MRPVHPLLPRLVCALLITLCAAPPSPSRAGMSARERRAITRNAYPNGDVYYLIGDLSLEQTDVEFRRYAGVARWLAPRGFRPILNPVAYLSDVQEAVTAPDAVAIIWSSHGSPSGEVFDAGETVLPVDIFSADAGKRLKLFVLSNCHGECTIQHHSFPTGSRQIHWTGPTDSNALQNYLFSSDFNDDLFKAAGAKIEKCTSRFSRVR